MKIISIPTFLVLLFCSVNVFAADQRFELEIDVAMEQYKKIKHFVPGVTFHFGEGFSNIKEEISSQPIVLRTSRLGKKGSGGYSYNKLDHTISGDEESPSAKNKRLGKACHRLFSVLMSRIAKRALDQGANAVVNIVGNFKGNQFISDSTYECYVGSFNAAIALELNYVVIE